MNAIVPNISHLELDALNPGQQDAVQQVFQFLFSDEREFSVTGPAGTGKTHLMKFIMKHTLREYQNACKLLGIPWIDYEIALTATTNKATEVLATSTGFPTNTVHAFMNLRVKDNYKTGGSEIIPKNTWKVHTKTLLFVDEASMVDQELHNYLIGGTDKTCKIIYLGDRSQLAPVFEKISPVYANSKRTAVLSQPMRNAGQMALMDLCDQLRETVETLKFNPILEVPGVIDFVDATGAYDFIKETFIEENPDARILVYSNVRVHDYNGYIRELRGHPDHFVPGETLISNSAFTVPSSKPPATFQIESLVQIEELNGIREITPIDIHDVQSNIEIYRARVSPDRGFTSHKVMIPADPERFKQLMGHYFRIKQFDNYFYMKNTFPDLRPKDAATVYKAQGSTYHTVFLDLTNIGSCTKVEQLSRMLYVGASRATTRLVLYGELPKRLFK